jgi:cell wall-associated NlpC family hydrolase
LGKHRRPSAWQTSRSSIYLATAVTAGAVTITGTLVAVAAEPAPAPSDSQAEAVAAAPVVPEDVAAAAYAHVAVLERHRGTSGSPPDPVAEAVPVRSVLAQVAERERARAEREAKREAKRKALRKIERKKALKRAASARRAKRASRSFGRLSGDAQRVLSVAASLQGSSYARGGDGPRSFDCSGFTQYVFSKVGMSLPHSSSAQRGVAAPVSAADVRPGDLVFVYNGGGGRVGHVAIYAGPGLWYEAQGYGRPVGRHGAWSSNVSYGRVL